MFPPVEQAEREGGLLAAGGELTPPWLLLAYERGIFPWFDADQPLLWWSPDPRAHITPQSLHVPRRLERRLRRGEFRATWNASFGRVIRGCAESREGGTWLHAAMIDAYEELHRLGHAHSLEVWSGDVLAGGLYGVQRGALFSAESMFHRVTDASKAALVCAVRSLFAAGITVFDVQLRTDHLSSLGAVEWPRRKYLAEVGAARTVAVDLRSPRLRFAAEDAGVAGRP